MLFDFEKSDIRQIKNLKNNKLQMLQSVLIMNYKSSLK